MSGSGTPLGQDRDSGRTPPRQRLLLRFSLPGTPPDEVYVAKKLTIGRTPDNVFVIPDESVDRHHAAVDLAQTEQGEQFILRCLSPEGYLEVEGRRERELVLRPGVRFRIGPAEFECLGTPEPSRTTPTPKWSVCPHCGSENVPGISRRVQECPACNQQIMVLGDSLGQRVVLPAVVGPCQLVRLEGQGGMAWVIQALIEGRKDPVAVKILMPHLLSEEVALQRFRREIQILSNLHHPRVLRRLGQGKWKNLPCLITPLLRGGSLRDVITRNRKAGRPCDFQTAWGWFLDVVDGLRAIHQAGLVHRDLKPSNILLDDNKQAVVADLGIARRLDPSTESLTATGAFLGTVHYMAPEQWQCPEAVDNRADQFALGIMFYELLTGRLPSGRWQPPSTLNPSVPKAFDILIERLVSPQPQDRYENLDALLKHATELGLLSAATPAQQVPLPLPQQPAASAPAGGPSPLPQVAMMPQLVPAPQESLPSATAGQGGRAVVRQENHPVGVPATYVPDIDLKSVLKTLQGSWSVWASKHTSLPVLWGFILGFILLPIGVWAAVLKTEPLFFDDPPALILFASALALVGGTLGSVAGITIGMLPSRYRAFITLGILGVICGGILGFSTGGPSAAFLGASLMPFLIFPLATAVDRFLKWAGYQLPYRMAGCIEASSLALLVLTFLYLQLFGPPGVRQDEQVQHAYALLALTTIIVASITGVRQGSKPGIRIGALPGSLLCILPLIFFAFQNPDDPPLHPFAEVLLFLLALGMCLAPPGAFFGWFGGSWRRGIVGAVLGMVLGGILGAVTWFDNGIPLAGQIVLTSIAGLFAGYPLAARGDVFFFGLIGGAIGLALGFQSKEVIIGQCLLGAALGCYFGTLLLGLLPFIRSSGLDDEEQSEQQHEAATPAGSPSPQFPSSGQPLSVPQSAGLASEPVGIRTLQAPPARQGVSEPAADPQPREKVTPLPSERAFPARATTSRGANLSPSVKRPQRDGHTQESQAVSTPGRADPASRASESRKPASPGSPRHPNAQEAPTGAQPRPGRSPVPMTPNPENPTEIPQRQLAVQPSASPTGRIDADAATRPATTGQRSSPLLEGETSPSPKQPPASPEPPKLAESQPLSPGPHSETPEPPAEDDKLTPPELVF
jgi:serine/threonine protein kinase